MGDPLEIEIKLVAAPAMLEALRQSPLLAGEGREALLRNTYFDTADGRLGAQGAALRVREGEGERQQTLKLPAVDGPGRREWTAAAPAEGPPLPDAFPPRARAALNRLAADAPLTPFAAAQTARTVRRLRYRHSTIEAAFDTVRIVAREQAEETCELELELVTGRLADVLNLAGRLPLGPDLWWSVRSKTGRAHALAFADRPVAVRALPVSFSPAPTVREGFHAIAWNCLSQLLANLPLVIADADPEAVHQSRVALRRLAAALSLFRPVTSDADTPVLRAGIGAATRGLGEARDLFVLAGRVERAARRTGLPAAELLAHIAACRARADGAAQAEFAGSVFQHLLVRFAEWTEGAGWSRAEAVALAQPLAPFAATRLAARRRKLLRKGRDLSTLSPPALHRLRIEAKKLRYGIEFFAPLFDGPASARIGKALERLQDSLGELNDMAVAARGGEHLFAGIDPILGAELEARLRELTVAERKTERKLLSRADKALRKIADLPKPWAGVRRKTRAGQAQTASASTHSG